MKLQREIYVLAVHGLLGNMFSRSMDGFAAAVNAHTPRGCHANIFGGNDPDFDVAEIDAQVLKAIGRGAIIVPVGHSLGADYVSRLARSLKQSHPDLRIPMLGVVDPTDWDSDANTFQAGTWEVDNNVDLVINPYQAYYPGGGHVVLAAGNTTTRIKAMYMPQYPHAAIYGYDIGSCPETQSALLAQVQIIVTQNSK